MNKINNIVLSVSMDEESIGEFSDLEDSEILKSAENIHLVHIYNKKHKYNLPTAVDPDNFNEVEAYVTQRLHKLRNELIPDHTNKMGDPHSLCVFNASEKVEILNYLERIEADLVIASTRRIHEIEGLSQNSFSVWLVEHATCNVLILRPKKHI